MRILLIAGHGAGDSGAVGNGFQEQERTRAIVEQLKGRITGATVDVFDTSKNCVTECRAGRIPNFKPYDYVLEVHLNASTNPAARGTMCYIDQSETGHSVEDAIMRHMYDIGYVKAWDGVVVTQRQFTQGLVVQNRCRQQGVSHCLLETCFISNKEDIDRLNSMMAQTAQAIADGIIEGFKLKKDVAQGVPNTSLCGTGIATAVAKESMTIRDGASCADNKLSVIYKGTAVEVLEELENGWLKIVWPGAACGYAYTSNVSDKYYDIV